MANIIINADDLGIHPDIDRGIAESFQQGILSSATVLMTTPFTERAVVDIVKKEHIPCGIHLALTLGWALTSPEKIPDLVDNSGAFKLTAKKLINCKKSPEFWRQVKIELSAQIQLMLDLGVRPTHFDFHQHIQLNKNILSIAISLGKQYSIPAMRIGHEPAWPALLLHQPLIGIKRLNLLKWLLAKYKLYGKSTSLKTTNHFFGFLHSGTFNAQLLLRLLNYQDIGKTWEIACHPGYPANLEKKKLYPQNGVDDFITSAERMVEMNAVCKSEVVSTFKNSCHKLISFADLHNL